MRGDETPLKTRPLRLLTTPEPCESCGELVAMTERIDDGARRLSNIDEKYLSTLRVGQEAPFGAVRPGGHTPSWCQMRRERRR